MYKVKKEKCPLCGSAKLKKHFRIENYKEHFDTDRCNDCGFIFMNPVFDDKTLESFYSREYYEGEADYSYIDERQLGKFADYVYDARIRKIKSQVPEVGSGNFLDVGCSFGGLLQSASKFFTPYGIELSKYSYDHASKKFPGNIHNGTIEDHPFEHDFFSVITMIELIEHLENPAYAIDESYRLLHKGGLLVVQTANMDGRQAKVEGPDYAYYMPGHLSYFSKENLVSRIKEAGFRSVKVFQPVDFGLIPKLRKSRGSFRTLKNYMAWYRISKYHLLSKIHWGNFAMTSSMVVYAVK